MTVFRSMVHDVGIYTHCPHTASHVHPIPPGSHFQSRFPPGAHQRCSPPENVMSWTPGQRQRLNWLSVLTHRWRFYMCLESILCIYIYYYTCIFSWNLWTHISCHESWSCQCVTLHSSVLRGINLQGELWVTAVAALSCDTSHLEARSGELLGHRTAGQTQV